MAAVDPDAGQVISLRRTVIVEERLGDVDQVVLADPDRADLGEEAVEVALCRLVGADVLGGDDQIEVDAEFGITLRKRGAIDIREDDQLESLFEPLERLSGV